MPRLSILVRVPAFLVGLCICIAILPIDYLLLAWRALLPDAVIAFTRMLFAPMVVLASALLDLGWWPRYLRRWSQAHRRQARRRAQLGWGRPFRRFRELADWLPVRRRRTATQRDWAPGPAARREVRPVV